MSCSHPLVADWDFKNKCFKTSHKFKEFGSSSKAIDYLNANYSNTLLLPCRKCVSCRMDNAKEWAIRSSLHIKSAPNNNWFITLTYDNAHLPIADTGWPTIRSSDLTRFIKTLRKHFERLGVFGIKYLAGSEYGSKRGRPHYHLLMYGLPLDDLVRCGETNQLNQPYYTSALISRFWKNGIHRIGVVNYESSGYVARYTLKKQSKLDYDLLGIEPEKLRMSKGIGLNYFNEHYSKIYDLEFDNVIVKTDKGVRHLAPPKYFDRQLEKIDPFTFSLIKQQRKNRFVPVNLMNIENDSRSFVDILASKQHLEVQRLKTLKRNLKKNN